MAEFQDIGDKQSLSKGPRNYTRSKFSGGQKQDIGDHVPMSPKPVPLQSGNKHVKGGAYQDIGTSVNLSKAPQRGWNSAPTPMSDRVNFQSLVPGLSGSRKARRK